MHYIAENCQASVKKSCNFAVSVHRAGSRPNQRAASKIRRKNNSQVRRKIKRRDLNLIRVLIRLSTYVANVSLC